MSLKVSKSALVIAAGLAGLVSALPAHAQNAGTRPAPTAVEQAAILGMLNQINSLSGQALVNEVSRLTKQYADQGLNVGRIAASVKAASGNKLGAVNLAFTRSCTSGAPGAAATAAACEAAAVAPEGSDGTLASTQGPGLGGIEPAGIGGAAGGGGGGGLPGLTGGTGTGTGGGASGASVVSGTGGTQSGFSGGTSGHSSSVGSSSTTQVVSAPVSPTR